MEFEVVASARGLFPGEVDHLLRDVHPDHLARPALAQLTAEIAEAAGHVEDRLAVHVPDHMKNRANFHLALGGGIGKALEQPANHIVFGAFQCHFTLLSGWKTVFYAPC